MKLVKFKWNNIYESNLQSVVNQTYKVLEKMWLSNSTDNEPNFHKKLLLELKWENLWQKNKNNQSIKPALKVKSSV